MSEWIKTAKVGDKVVALSFTGSEGGYGDEILPIEGTVYTIRDIMFHEGAICFRLEEIRNDVRLYLVDGAPCVCEITFKWSRFRPVQPRQTDISVFERLLNTVPSDLEVV
jgi:hypothetical protein